MYGELGYTSTSTKETDGPDTFKASPKALRGIVAYEAHPNLAVEGLFAFGMGRASISGPDVPSSARLKIDNAYGVYLKPKTKLGEAIEVFGRIGYAKVTYKFSSLNASESEKEDGLSYGLGLNYALTPSVYLSLDYLQYTKAKGVKTTGTTFSIGYRF
jgi:opacity protein-like surface antigen